MSSEQLQRRIELLEAERRESERAFAQLARRVEGFEDALDANRQLLSEFRKEAERLSAAIDTVEEMETRIKVTQEENQRNFKQQADKNRKDIKDRFKEVQATVSEQYESFVKELRDLRDEFNVKESFERELRALEEEDTDLAKSLNEVHTSLKQIQKNEGQREKLAKNLEDSGRKIENQISQMQSELSVSVQRMDEAVKSVQKVEAVQQKLQNKFDDLASGEERRRAAQREFTTKAAADQVERERMWAEWEKRFKAVEGQSEEIAKRLKDIETIDLSVQRAQKSFDELVERINRRVNELTEVQRLGEQRFRQEWSTFQADSQKRWAGHMLSQEEQQKEATRERERLANQVVQMGDSLRDLQETVQHVSEQTDHLLQSLLEAARDSLAENERFYASVRE